LAAVAVLTAALLVIGTAWAVRLALAGSNRFSEDLSKAVLSVAEFPGRCRDALQELTYSFSQDPGLLLIDRAATEKPGWIRSFPNSQDSGYLLFSGVDPVAKHSVVKLIRIADGVTMATWDPDWQEIYAKTTWKKWAQRGQISTLRALHPVLLEGGDIIFNTLYVAVRMGPCGRHPAWVLDETIHHSVELADDGTLWTAGVSTDGFSGNPWLRDRVRDDALVRLSVDGHLIEKRAFSEVLISNGLQSLLGGFGFELNKDPIHINQIQVAPSDTKHWQRGDLLISARHLSTVFLYRPSTGRVVWYQTGPWMNQHSAEFVGDHSISVLSNNIVAGVPPEYAFLKTSDINRVFLFDFDSGSVTEPFADLLAKARPATVTEGRAHMLADGGLFFEDTNSGRHLRFTEDSLLWSRVNDYDDDRIGMLSWSRYLSADDARVPLKALAALPCTGKERER
jgi:hypothetical protein